MYTCPMHPEVQKNKPGSCPICGMALELVSPKKDEESKNNKKTENSEYYWMLGRFWIGVILSLPLIFIPMKDLFQLILATPVVIVCGWPFFVRGFLSLKNLKLNMFTLISMGVGTAYIYSIFKGGYFEPAAAITTLVLLGQVMELKARSRTNSAIKQLLNLAPPKAILIKEDQSESEVPVAHIQVSNLLRVQPGAKIPVDGIVISGHSSVDQSMVTGESMPIEKDKDDLLIGGTLNGTGSFIMRATKVGHETLLAQIVDMVSKAQRTKAPIQKLADTVSSYFVPIVILIALMTFFTWYIFGPSPKIDFAILTSVAVLIIACPCALGLATPMSIMVGLGQGAKAGILVKNSEALETLSKINTLVIDKTGTLTEGKPSVSEIVVLNKNYSESDILTFSASLERGSEHPLANAIINFSKTKNIKLEEPKNFKSLTGLGVTGNISGLDIALGNQKLMESLNITITPKNYIYLAINNQLAGYLIIKDKIKSDTPAVIAALKKQNINIIMLTGDNAETAAAIAKEAGIDDFKADILPQHKFEYIQELQKKGLIVAMAGDGVNDAPALTQANVGIAMGKGTDIAMESAGIVLVSGSLMGILKAKKLSEAILTNIRQNLFLAFIYNILAIPVAAGIFYPFFGILLSPVIASAAMSLSSVSVIVNALRLSNLRKTSFE
jgi:heavy metal translocating P-type ATPase